MDLGHYFASSDAIAGSILAAQNLLTIENPSSSGINVCVDKIEVHGILSVLSLLVFQYKVGRTTALPSGGTTLTAQAGDTAMSPTAIVKTGSTATLAAGYIWTASPSIMVTGVGQSVAYNAVAYNNPNVPIMLAPGEALLIQVDISLTTWTHYVNIHWCEGIR